MGTGQSAEQKDKSPFHLETLFPASSQTKIQNEAQDVAQKVMERVQSQLQYEILSATLECGEEIRVAYDIYANTEKSLAMSPLPIEDWVQENRYRKCNNGHTFETQWEQYESQMKLHEALRSKNPDQLTDKESYELQKLQNQFVQEARSTAVQEYIKKMSEALQNEELFYRFFFVEYAPVKFVSRRQALRKGLTEEEFERRHNTIIQQYRAYLPTVQLMLMDIGGNTLDFFRKFYATHCTQFGATHAALQIGPYIIEWNNGNLVFPRDLRSSKIILRLPYNLPQTATSEDVLRAISTVCIKFNKTVKYENINIGASRQNCHGFVESVTRAINVTQSWSANGPVAQFLKSVKESKSTNFTDFCITIGNDHVTVVNMMQLRAIWNRVRFDNQRTDLEELKMIIKSIERCFRFQLRDAQTKNNPDRVKEICPDGDFSQIISTSTPVADPETPQSIPHHLPPVSDTGAMPSVTGLMPEVTGQLPEITGQLPEITGELPSSYSGWGASSSSTSGNSGANNISSAPSWRVPSH